MRKLFLFLSLSILSCNFLNAQLQTSDGEGVAQASALKKLAKKAKFGAFLIETEISFGTGKGLDNLPVVTAKEKAKVEMTAMENNAVVGYLLPYNQFVKLNDYDFEIFYRNSFKSQKYPPEKVSLTDDAIFFDDNYGQFYSFKASEMGQRSRFKYNYEYTDAKYLTRMFFHEGIPIKQNKIAFHVPDWLQLDIIEKNFEGYKIKKDKRTEKGITTYTFTADNLPPIKQEPLSLARPFYLPHLVITVRSFSINQNQYNGFKTLDDMYAWYNRLYKKAQNKPEELKTHVQQLLQGKNSDEEKVKSLYYWVQDNIRYIAFEEGYAGFVPQTVQEVYKNKYGDCKGMANLLTEMLKLAGYDAHFAWIGTRDIPYDRTEIQSMCVDNHAISVLYLKDKVFFLDGTEKYASLGKNAYRIQGKQVMVEHGDKYKVERVAHAVAEENIILTKADLALDKDKITGHVKIEFDGESKSFFHYVYNNIPANKRKDFINALVKLSNNNTEVSDIKTSDFKNRDIPIVIEGNVEITDQVTLVDKTCYTNIDFFPATITRFIPDDERQTPIDMDHVFVANDEVSLSLPANAKVETLPESFKTAYANDHLDASYSNMDNKVILKKKMLFNSPVIHPAQFKEWKDFLTKIKEFNRSNIKIQL